MEDPIYTLDFIKYIIDVKHKSIVGVTIAKGERLKIGKKKSKFMYLFSLLLIMGIFHFLKNTFRTLIFKIGKILSKQIPFIRHNGLREHAKKYNIPIDFTENPNSPEFVDKLQKSNIDLIINQSQFIVKQPLLNVSKIGMLNRHNALLPKNRGRLTPFWVLYKQEKETGVSIHFVDEGIDSGEIVVQRKFLVSEKETFNSLVKKNYQIAPKAMIEAIDKIERGDIKFLENKDELATYNSIPSLCEAWNYRKRRIQKRFGK
jgi:methionyl-tRNA formyltransferase